MNKTKFNALNRERGELIDKEINGTITESETKRLQELQDWIGDWLDKHHPLPDVPEDLLNTIEGIAKSLRLPPGWKYHERSFIDSMTGVVFLREDGSRVMVDLWQCDIYDRLVDFDRRRPIANTTEWISTTVRGIEQTDLDLQKVGVIIEGKLPEGFVPAVMKKEE